MPRKLPSVICCLSDAMTAAPGVLPSSASRPGPLAVMTTRPVSPTLWIVPRICCGPAAAVALLCTASPAFPSVHACIAALATIATQMLATIWYPFIAQTSSQCSSYRSQYVFDADRHAPDAPPGRVIDG